MKKNNKPSLIQKLKTRIELDRTSFAVYSVLRILVIITGVRAAFLKNYESMAICVLSLILFLLPSLFEETFKLEIPTLFQVIIYLFIYAAEILGEINNFYTVIPHWDTMLHTINGFLFAAVGFSMVGIMNRGSKYISLSPFYLALMGFCFSMTIGVLWEFFEFGMDDLVHFDMQKDFIVTDFASTKLDETNSQKNVRLKDISSTTITLSDGSSYEIDDGYLDIGLKDTMKDLFVNFIGAFVFCFITFFDEKRRVKNPIAKDLMFQPLSDEEINKNHLKMNEYLSMTSKERRAAFKRDLSNRRKIKKK